MSGLSLVAGLAVGPAVLASDSADVTKALAGSTALELPAKAANLVAKASAADKKNVAVAAVKAAVALNPSAPWQCSQRLPRSIPRNASPSEAAAIVSAVHDTFEGTCSGARSLASRKREPAAMATAASLKSLRVEHCLLRRTVRPFPRP